VDLSVAEIKNIFTDPTVPSLIAIFGRPSTGKTTLSLSVIQSVLGRKGNDFNIIYLSLQERKEAIFQRLGISDDHLNKTKYLRLFVDDSLHFKRAPLERHARKDSNKKALIFVDYIQLIERTKISVDFEKPIDRMSREFLAISRDLNATVVLLSQVPKIAETFGFLPHEYFKRFEGLFDALLFVEWDNRAADRNIYVFKNKFGRRGWFKARILKESGLFEGF